MSQDIFPLLSVAEITNTCQEMFPGLKVTEEDFTNPKAENIRALYVYLLESVTNCNVEVIFSPQVENIDHNDLLSYPELHVESIPPVNILFAMKSVMQSAGISNFQMKDLTTPKPKRVARIMSAFINFAHHSNNIGELFEEVLGEIEAKREAYHALLENLKRNHAAEDAEIQELKQKIESDTDLISKEKKEAVVIQRQIAESDASLASKNSRIVSMPRSIISNINSFGIINLKCRNLC
ncbi:PREDICTED: kinetochore protein Nuf2-like [Priapulus caudatus]|uniref:Kinetochore protein Nuf2-like n=1 Tax=Priapulus caudatus TaxID=37621 RepID=A0ABM1EZR5_PRICU|nr:PREDICTED: kinetochore protein Nuf2-like [Priapulus caudatus]